MPRKYTRIHDQLLMNFLLQNFPLENFIVYPRIGEIQEEYLEKLSLEEKRMMAVWKLRPDAIAWDEKFAYVIELIVRPNEWYKAAKLVQYEELLKKDPEYSFLKDKTWVKWLVSTEKNVFAERECKRLNVHFIKFRPDWTLEYLGAQMKRNQRPFGQILK